MSAIVSRGARERERELRVAGHHKKSRRMRMAIIHSLRSNCPDETRDDVSVGWVCDHDESCTTTAFSDSAWGAKRVSGSGGAADTRGGVWRTARKQSRYAAREQVTAHGNGKPARGNRKGRRRLSAASVSMVCRVAVCMCAVLSVRYYTI